MVMFKFSIFSFDLAVPNENCFSKSTENVNVLTVEH